MKKVIIIILGFFAINSFGINPNKLMVDDSVKVSFEVDIDHFTNSLDSLMSIWYVQNSMQLQEEDFYLASDSFVPPVFPDTIMLKRLAAINSAVDLSYNEVVQRFIDLYSTRRKTQTEVMLGLSEYYFPIFESYLDYYNLPLELKYLAVIESALNPRAVSRAGATGMWQFMYATGRLYKLRINSYVDERRDPVISTDAAARYLRDLHNIYKDWSLAIAAYNCGPGNVNKAIRRSGKTTYWEIYNFLPRETRGYVPAFVGALYVMNNYKDYNIVPKKIDFPLNTDTILITERLHFGQIAEVLDISIDMLRDLNPQYRRDIIPAGDTYPLRLPVEYSLRFISLQDSIFNYQDSIFNKNIYASVPQRGSGSSSSRAFSGRTPANSEKISYTIKSGDNLGFISSWFGVTVNDLRDWNGIHGNNIRAGRKLDIYVPKDKVDYYKNFNNMTFAQKQNSIGSQSSSTVAESKPLATTTNDTSEYTWYTVKSGDNFWSIANNFPGVSNTDIMQFNGITNASSLKPGQKLKIPKK